MFEISKYSIEIMRNTLTIYAIIHTVITYEMEQIIFPFCTGS